MWMSPHVAPRASRRNGGGTSYCSRPDHTKIIELVDERLPRTQHTEFVPLGVGKHGPRLSAGLPRCLPCVHLDDQFRGVGRRGVRWTVVEGVQDQRC